LDFRDKGDLKDKSWRELCEAASREHDPERLLELITALNDLLEQKEEEEKANRNRAAARQEFFKRHPMNIVAA
jgi:DNA polymerase II large subunit